MVNTKEVFLGFTKVTGQLDSVSKADCLPMFVWLAERISPLALPKCPKRGGGRTDPHGKEILPIPEQHFWQAGAEPQCFPTWGWK